MVLSTVEGGIKVFAFGFKVRETYMVGILCRQQVFLKTTLVNEPYEPYLTEEETLGEPLELTLLE